MRILWKECKKILDIRLLMVLGIFTFLFYSMFMEISSYPAGGQCTDSPYDIPFMAKLVKKYGPTLPVADRSVSDEVLGELKEKCDSIIAENEILKEAGISTFNAMESRREELGEQLEEEQSDEEKTLMQEMDKLIFENTEFSRISFEIQQMEGVYEFAGHKYGVPKEKAHEYIEEMYGDTATELYKKAMEQRCTKEEISLIPEGVFYIIQEDMRYMALLLFICFTVLMVSYQVKEHLRGVMPLYAATRTGRRIFRKQFFAGMAACGFVGIIQMLIYFGIFAGKGLLVFFSCPAWAYATNSYWLDFLPFGVYMVLYMFLVWLFAMAGLTFAYLIGRKAANYIAGIALAIPLCGAAGALGLWMFSRLFFIHETQRIPFWEPMVLGGWMVFAVIFLVIRLRMDKKRDIS